MPPEYQAGQSTPQTNPVGEATQPAQSLSQSQYPNPTSGTGAAPMPDDPYARPGWSWGAFMMGPFFLIAVRKYVHLLWYLLSIIPIVPLVIAIFLGLKGRELAAESKSFANRDEYRGFMKAFDHAGFITFIIMIVLLVLYALFFVVILVPLVNSGPYFDTYPSDPSEL